MRYSMKLLTTFSIISSFSTSSLANSDITTFRPEKEVMIEEQVNKDTINNEEIVQDNNNLFNLDNLVESNENTKLTNNYTLNLIQGNWNRSSNILNVFGTVRIETNAADLLVSNNEILYRDKNNTYKIDVNGEMLLDNELAYKFDEVDSNKIIATINNSDVADSDIEDSLNSSKDGTIITDSNSLIENSELKIILKEQGFVIQSKENTVSIDNNELLNINNNTIVLDENLIGEKNNINLIEDYSLKSNLDALSKQQEQVPENSVVIPKIEEIKETIVAQDEIQKTNIEAQEKEQLVENKEIIAGKIDTDNTITTQDKPQETNTNKQEILLTVEDTATAKESKTTDIPIKGEDNKLAIEQQNNKLAEVEDKTKQIDKETQQLKSEVISLKNEEKAVTADVNRVTPVQGKAEVNNLELEKQDKKIEELNTETQSLKNDVIKFNQNEKVVISKNSAPIIMKPKNTSTKKNDDNTNNRTVQNNDLSSIEGEQIANLNSQDVGNLQVIANPETEKINSDIFVEVAKIDNPKETLTYCLSPESNFENGQALASGDYLVKDIYFANQELDDKYSFDYNDVIKSLKGQTTYLRIQVYEGDKPSSMSSTSEDIQMNDLVADPLTANLEGAVKNNGSENPQNTSSIIINVIFIIAAAIISITLLERKFHFRKRLIHKDFRKHKIKK